MNARTTNSARTTFRFSSNSIDLSLISKDMLKKRAIFLHPVDIRIMHFHEVLTEYLSERYSDEVT